MHLNLSSFPFSTAPIQWYNACNTGSTEYTITTEVVLFNHGTNLQCTLCYVSWHVCIHMHIQPWAHWCCKQSAHRQKNAKTVGKVSKWIPSYIPLPQWCNQLATKHTLTSYCVDSSILPMYLCPHSLHVHSESAPTLGSVDGAIVCALSMPDNGHNIIAH